MPGSPVQTGVGGVVVRVRVYWVSGDEKEPDIVSLRLKFLETKDPSST